jgi:hypothetical protein
MNFIDQQSLLLGGSLLVLVIVNIILGSISSLFQQQFDKTKFWQGLVKGSIIVICFCLVLIVGKANAGILVVNVNDQNLDLATATQMLMTTSYAWYGLEIYKKMTGLLSGKYKEEVK